MANLPFLGAKISLISKCNIRYVGTLHSVDPKESTISLSKVRSYGTETRGDEENYVLPRSEIYDLIIFRASDIKDLVVDTPKPEPPGLSDPAIISTRQSSSNKNYAGLIEGSPPSPGPFYQFHSKDEQESTFPIRPTGSNHKEQATQEQSRPTNYSSAAANAQRRGRPDNQKDIGNSRKSDSTSGRDGGPRRGGEIGDRRTDKRDDRRDDRRNDRRNDDRRPYGRREHDVGRRGDGRPPMRNNRGDYERNHVNSRYNNSNNSRGGPSHKDDRSRGPPMNRRGGQTGSRRGRSDDRLGGPRGTRKSAPLKFEGEYDFDEANKLFLELEGKLKNMKIKDGAENGEGSAERNNSKSSNDGSESGSAYDSEDHTNEKEGDSKEGRVGGSVSGEFYDKSKSFFDNISCEASERSQGKVNKPDWRKERQLNAETFGISASYRRGGYRGRSYGTNGYHRR